MDENQKNGLNPNLPILLFSGVLVCATLFGAFQIIEIKSELQMLRNQGQNSIVQYQNPAPVNNVYVGSADSMLHEFTCKPNAVSGQTVIYGLAAKVKEYSQGDKLYFMMTLDGKASFIEAASDNGVVFTASIEVPIDKQWSVDFVSDRSGTRKSEVLQSFNTYNQFVTERWSFPSMEGNAENISNSKVYKTSRRITMNFGGETDKSVGIAEAVSELRLNGKAFKAMPMTSKIYSGNPGEFAQQEIEANFGQVEIPCKEGDVIETVTRIKTDTGKWYICTLERLKHNGTVVQNDDIGMYEWKAE